MALTITNVRRSGNTQEGKIATADVQFDASYATGGETLDLTAAPFGGTDAFTSVNEVAVVEGPYTSAGAVLAITVATKIDYAPAASRAPATGTLRAWNFSAADATGVFQQVAATTDLSTVFCRIRVTGT